MIAIDNSPTRLALARHNAALYGVVDRIEFVLGDFVSFAETYKRRSASGTPLHGPADAEAPSSAPGYRPIDVVFLSPPWGGVDYLSFSPSKLASTSTAAVVPPITPLLTSSSQPASSSENTSYSLSNTKPLHGAELFHLARSITPNVAFFLPRNQDLEEISRLVAPTSDNRDEGGDDCGADNNDDEEEDNQEQEMVEVEEEWMGNKLKALTCYFGGLAQGQQHHWSS